MGAIATAETAIIAALAGQSITCLAYEPKQLPSDRVATLWITDVGQGYSGEWEQRFCIGEVSWTFRYYVRVLQNEKTSYDQMRSAVETIYGALGVDRSLGGAVASCTLSNGGISLAVDGQNPLLVFDATLTATLNPQ